MSYFKSLASKALESEAGDIQEDEIGLQAKDNTEFLTDDKTAEDLLAADPILDDESKLSNVEADAVVSDIKDEKASIEQVLDVVRNVSKGTNKMSFYKELKAALESEELTTDVAMDDVEAAELSGEIELKRQEIDNDIAEVEKTEAIADELDTQNAMIRQSVADGTFDETAAAGFEAARRSAVVALGGDPDAEEDAIVDSAGLESMVNSGVVALENNEKQVGKIREYISKAWEAIKNGFKWLADKVKQFMNWLLAKLGSSTAKIKRMSDEEFKAAVEKFKASEAAKSEKYAILDIFENPTEWSKFIAEAGENFKPLANVINNSKAVISEISSGKSDEDIVKLMNELAEKNKKDSTGFVLKLDGKTYGIFDLKNNDGNAKFVYKEEVRNILTTGWKDAPRGRFLDKFTNKNDFLKAVDTNIIAKMLNSFYGFNAKFVSNSIDKDLEKIGKSVTDGKKYNFVNKSVINMTKIVSVFTKDYIAFIQKVTAAYNGIAAAIVKGEKTEEEKK